MKPSGFRYVVPLTGCLHERVEELGGKGSNLQRLVRANLPVPGAFVITTAAYRRCLARLTERGAVRCGPEEFAARIRAVQLEPDMAREFASAATLLRALTGGALVVRSSATVEDVEGGSMAGQAASFINVTTDPDLLSAVCGCWASLFSREAVAYRSNRRSGAFPEMAVVVQQLIPARRAGVLFTRDPIDPADSRVLVSASWGLGETVVGGLASDTFRLDKESGEICQQEVAFKESHRVPEPAGGTVALPLSPELASQPVVDADLAHRLCDLARRLEQLFGCPQDVEWAEEDGRLYLLQTRPITTAATPRRTVWSCSNVGEALPGVGTPLTWSVIRSFSRQGMVHAFAGLGCVVPPEYRIVGDIRGRVYLNLSEFMSVASQIPFVTPELLQRVAGGGGAEALTPGSYRQLSHAPFLARLPWSAAAIAVAHGLAPSRIAFWSQRFGRFARRFAATRLHLLTTDELVALTAQSDQVFEETGTMMLECSGRFLMTYLATTFVLRNFHGGEAGRLEQELFSGLSGVRTAEPGLDLMRMARKVATRPELRRLVVGTPPGELLGVLEQGDREARSLHSAVEAFLQSHGHRAAREAELSEPRWSEDPSFPLSMLIRYLEEERLADPEALQAQRMELRREVTAEALSGLPAPSRSLFLRLLRVAQDAARVREEMRNAVVHTLFFLRSLALEVGRRMADTGLLPDSQAVFFLAREELAEWLGGREVGNRLGLRAAMRRWEHEVLLGLPEMPPWFVMEGDRILRTDPPAVGGTELSGLPGAPGRCQGRVVIVQTLADQGKVRAGDVLVAPFADVGWTPLFLVAGGVVTELGGPLSHSCVVAREYGVPTVVNVAGATSRLRDGDTVVVDGERGTVQIVASH